MVALTIIAKLRACAGVFAATAALLSTPAIANSSANVDVSTPVLTAQSASQAGQDGGDREFRQLFSSWRALDKGVALTAASSPFEAANRSVSIPSRNPLDGLRLTSDFGMRIHPVLGGHRMHKGIDLASPIGTPVHATADGVIGRADWFSSYGLFVAIEHGDSLETRYGHMSQLNVAAGQIVHKGDIIGYVGLTGRTTGAHLHYEVRIGGEAVNPVPYLQTGGVLQLASAADAGGSASAVDAADE